MIRSPAITKLSLLLSATSTPCPTEFNVGAIPEAPTKPFNIKSISSRLDISNKPSLPTNTFELELESSFFTNSAAFESIIETTSGLYFLACLTNNSPFLYALKATILNSFLSLSMTLKVLIPIEPVDPSIEILFIIKKFQ